MNLEDKLVRRTLWYDHTFRPVVWWSNDGPPLPSGLGKDNVRTSITEK